MMIDFETTLPGTRLERLARNSNVIQWQVIPFYGTLVVGGDAPNQERF